VRRRRRRWLPRSPAAIRLDLAFLAAFALVMWISVAKWNAAAAAAAGIGFGVFLHQLLLDLLGPDAGP
jgi:hypothetical protein